MAKVKKRPAKRKATVDEVDVLKGDTPSLRLEYIDPADLKANGRNWRKHPAAQLDALRDVVAEVGWAGALLFNERTDRLIDGHGRKELFEGKGPVPVLIGSWSEADEAKILTTLDPLAALAEVDTAALDALLRDVATGSEAIGDMLSKLAAEAGVVPKEEKEGGDESGQLSEKFQILVECDTESSQAQLLARLTDEGYTCRSLIS